MVGVRVEDYISDSVQNGIDALLWSPIDEIVTHTVKENIKDEYMSMPTIYNWYMQSLAESAYKYDWADIMPKMEDFND